MCKYIDVYKCWFLGKTLKRDLKEIHLTGHTWAFAYIFHVPSSLSEFLFFINWASVQHLKMKRFPKRGERNKKLPGHYLKIEKSRQLSLHLLIEKLCQGLVRGTCTWLGTGSLVGPCSSPLHSFLLSAWPPWAFEFVTLAPNLEKWFSFFLENPNAEGLPAVLYLHVTDHISLAQNKSLTVTWTWKG